MPKGDKFSPGDLVFAKVKGYPPWPARVQGFNSKDKYKIYFYGTHETASIKNEDIWLYSQETKEKFAPKNMKRKGYPEGLDQIENTPEIAAVDDDVDPNLLDTTVESPETPTTLPSKKKINTPATNKKVAAVAKTETPKASKAETPKSLKDKKLEAAAAAAKTEAARSTPKRKAVDAADQKSTDHELKSAKRAKLTGAGTGESSAGEESGPGDESGSEKTSRSGRIIKPKKFGETAAAVGTPTRVSEAETENIPRDGSVKGRKTGNKKTNNEEKENLTKSPKKADAKTPEEEKAKRLEKRKNKLRWLKIEQRLVELDIAIKSSLHLEKPSPDRCILALEELNELALAPFMLKKQPDIVITVRRLRKYIGPHKFNTWKDVEAKKKMEKSIETIQKKAEQIYFKFKSYFAYQGDKPFTQMFEEEVMELKEITKNMEEGKVLSMIRDPTNTDGSLSDED